MSITKLTDGHQARGDDGLDDELRDAVAGADLYRLLTVILEHDADRPAIVRIDYPCQNVDALLQRQARARPDHADGIQWQ